MFKKLLLAALIAVPATLSAQKFGVIQASEVMESMPEYQEMIVKIETASKTYEEEYKSLTAEFDKKYADMQALDESTPSTIRERRMQELQELNQKIGQFNQTASQDLQRQQAALAEPIQQKLLQAIQTVGQEGGYAFIFENQMPLYTGSVVEDVTPMVRALLGID